MSPQEIADRLVIKLFTKPDGLRLRRWRGQFWHWKEAEHKFEPVPQDDFRSFISQALNKMRETEGLENQITSALVTNVITNIAKDYIEEAREMPGWVVAQPVHPEQNLLTMKNGLVSLDAIIEGRPVVVYPHTPCWFSVTALPYSYDQAAQCPRWEEFLYQIFEGDLERIKLVQEWFGYCLTPNTAAQRFLVLEGEGANGKSVVCDVLAALLGKENVSHVPLELFGERFQLAATLGKLANITTEVGEVKSVAEGVLKQFTSGDAMQFERKGIDSFEAVPTARLVIATNSQPKFVDRSDGVWRRMILIPFNLSIPVARQDPELAQKLKQELPGILNWAAAGERRRLKQGGKFTMPKVCADAVAAYKLESNPARMFLTERLIESPVGFTSTDDVYTSYREWCKMYGYMPVSRSTFAKEVKRQYPKVERIKRREGGRDGTYTWQYAGLRFVEEPNGDPELQKVTAVSD